MVTTQYNRIVTVMVVGYTQNEMGGTERVVIDSWQRRANITDKTGGNSNPYNQQVWDYNRRVKMRHERTRPIQSNYEIEYQGQVMKIEWLTVDNERFAQEVECYCSNIDGVVTIPTVQQVLGNNAGLGISFNNTLISV